MKNINGLMLGIPPITIYIACNQMYEEEGSKVVGMVNKSQIVVEISSI